MGVCSNLGYICKGLRLIWLKDYLGRRLGRLFLVLTIFALALLDHRLVLDLFMAAFAVEPSPEETEARYLADLSK